MIWGWSKRMERTQRNQDETEQIDFLKHLICTEMPRLFSDVLSWHGHIPFAFFITEILRPGIFVELGTHKGDSFCAFCQAVQRLNLDCKCYAVDTWKGDEHSGFYGEEVLTELREYHDPLYGRFSTLMEMRFDEALPYFKENTIDLLHIDGLHLYEAVRHDFCSWLPKMSEKGVVLLHDINVYENDFGVWKLWNELKEKYPNFEFTHSYGLGILGIGKALPADVRKLFNLNAEDIRYVRGFFSDLGAGVPKNNAGDSYFRQSSDADSVIIKYRQQLTEKDHKIAELEKQIAASESPGIGGVCKIEIEDYYRHNMKRRYGGILPPHQAIDNMLAQKTDQYKNLLKQFTCFTDQFLSIRKSPDPEKPQEPQWINGLLPGFDAISIFGLVSIKKPKIYMEIGSGYSTKFAAKAVRLNSPSTRIISIDPCPRTEIDTLCDTVIRKPLEECDMTLFDELSPNDILFFDGSHRVLQNSDNTVLFFEVIPRLKPGVYIHLHDIFWPFDYPDEWVRRMYSEQYVLGSILLYGYEKIEVILPNTFISWRTNLNKLFDALWNAPHLKGIERHGCSFWFVKKPL